MENQEEITIYSVEETIIKELNNLFCKLPEGVKGFSDRKFTEYLHCLVDSGSYLSRIEDKNEITQFDLCEAIILVRKLRYYHKTEQV